MKVISNVNWKTVLMEVATAMEKRFAISISVEETILTEAGDFIKSIWRALV